MSVTTHVFFKEFEDHVRRLFVKPTDKVGRITHATLGVLTEAGELGTTAKAHWIYGKELDVENVEEEIGDALFYLQALATECGLNLDGCMDANVRKLKKRYPDGYSDQAAKERADKA